MTVPDYLRGFLRELREHGLAVPVAKQRDFLSGLTLLPPRDVQHLYWIACSTLTGSLLDKEIFDPVFNRWFRGMETAVSEADEPGEEDRAGSGDAVPEQVVREGSGFTASSVDRVGVFDLGPNDHQLLAQLRKALPAAVPTVRSRRRVAARSGDRLDVRRVHREAWRTSGEIVRLRWRRHPRRQRPVLVLIDVSGSMKQHSRELLGFAHAVVTSCDRAEVFTFGTRLTRVTPALVSRDVEAALAEIVLDADGGTRIGPSLASFLGNARQLRMARGALVLVLSDGLERGDCVLFTKAVRRLSLLAHRLVWWSPLACDPAYRPVTRGMAAVAGYLDTLAGVSDLDTAYQQVAGWSRK